MSKMKSAQMTAIRFTESDVIVASTLVLGKYNNTTVGDGIVKYGETTYNTNGGEATYDALYEALAGRDYVEVHGGSGERMHIESVFYFENAANHYDEVYGSDGVYTWNGSSWVWKHQ